MPESPADTEKRWVVEGCADCGAFNRRGHHAAGCHSPTLTIEVIPASSFDALSEEHERLKAERDELDASCKALIPRAVFAEAECDVALDRAETAEAEKESMAAAIRSITRERDKARADLERLTSDGVVEEAAHVLEADYEFDLDPNVRESFRALARAALEAAAGHIGVRRS